MTLSLLLAEHVARTRYEDLPAAAVDAAKRSLLDAIGVSLGASGFEPACAPFVDLALAAGGAPQSTILGYGVKAPAQLAAFANGALAHALDFEDAYDGAPLHPNAALVPAALALAEARGGVSGRAFLTALAVGCDLVCRLALAAKAAPEMGWYPPPIFGAYGAVAAAGRVLGLDAVQMRDAFSLALHQSVCSGAIKYNPQSVHRAIRDAFPAQTGVVSAELAARGVAGFDQPFEGKGGFFQLFAGGVCDEAVLTDRLGAHFLGAEVSFKPWPSCRGTHAYIDMALTLVATGAFAIGQIERIELAGAPLQVMLMEPAEGKLAPVTAIDAKFSLPFVVATAFVRAGVGLDDFSPSALSDAAVLALARRVTYAVDPAIAAKGAAAGALRVVLSDGRDFSMTVDDALGGRAKPMDWPALVAKATMCARYARRPVDGGRIERLAGAIATIENAHDCATALIGPLTF
ncbi:MAG TPA: MmgE/PrpD family protein [Caulobacterales bacterium]|nr:MmgE/PrpD family protein [Caulobacterales bacterium]